MRLRILLLSGATLASMALPALADDAEIGRRLDRMQRMIERVNAPLPREAEPALTFDVEQGR